MLCWKGMIITASGSFSLYITLKATFNIIVCVCVSQQVKLAKMSSIVFRCSTYRGGKASYMAVTICQVIQLEKKIKTNKKKNFVATASIRREAT
uniref:Uncharacterized protein n=1 Tax=Octopus bimaculoides TaxID=37653 RepID=A0A0L8HTM2_OCTBM